MSTPRDPLLGRHREIRQRSGPARLLAVHSRKIALGVLCAAVLGAVGYGLAGNDDSVSPATDLAAARAAEAEAATRDHDRLLEATPTPSVTATPSPSVSPTRATTPKANRPATAKPKPTVKRTATTPTPTSCKSFSGNQLTACKLLPSFGFAYSQMSPLVKLWQHESGWNHKAENSGSGAYGIPQALPGSKMAKFGDDWKTNPATQIKWGLDYIKNRYQTPAGAWSHFQDVSWY
ncbi:aggregation-promoting factor C-terminal-like domain-containing protein [Catellatospora vulcania]|uniref:aggregation-promoting factor C-terminal-like domain-containing protein n=1 Tax=Catellatospora vulcania TaxID=1460450 RepID=UPI001E35CBB1|nr:transglycosylase SLT domain-containing protein [Catellatospora vulcania]